MPDAKSATAPVPSSIPLRGPSEWLPGNPWAWMVLALATGALSWGWMASLGSALPAPRYALLAVSLFAAGVALTIRLRFAEPAYLTHLAPSQRSLLLITMAGLFAMMALGVTVLLGLALFDLVRLSWGQMLFWWIVVAPMAVTAVRQCLRHVTRPQPFEAREEGAALLLLTAVVCFAGVWSLYDPEDPLFLDKMRLFLGVALLVSLVAAPLVLVPQRLRRQILSVLFVLHFAGMLTAALASPPSPLPVRQLWTRFYRPYLEFMYLINAYHFYAPEPGPTSYLWFRVNYENDAGDTVARWLKVPDLDDKGYYRYPTGLTYQRYVALTENMIPTDAPPPVYIVHPDGSLGPAPFYLRRVLHTPQAAKAPEILGVPRADVGLTVPWHPELSQAQQYLAPNASVKVLLASYVRHVAHSAAEKMPGFEVSTIKVYRAIHTIPMAEMYLSGVQEPDDPDTYRPVFLGEYDTEGKLLDPDEPFLYWMLPTIKENRFSPRSRFLCFARKHAGDPLWIRDENKQWVNK